MPRVSPEHTEARRRQILDAARRCFVRNGFHATSMQDVLVEAGLSAGATYRYFRGKEDIIAATAEDLLGSLADVFARAMEAGEPPPLHDMFLLIGTAFEKMNAEQDLAKLAVQVWSEAVRSPEVGARLGEILKVVRGRMVALVTICQTRGEIGPGDPEEISKVLVAMWPGFLLQHAVIGDMDAESFASGLRRLLGHGQKGTR